MSRAVIVECAYCNCEMLLDLKPEKADGGFYACDIEHELREHGWAFIDGKELCDECAPPTKAELATARTGAPHMFSTEE